MKLWEIKAQALRLMFTDFDLQFVESDFVDGTVYQNPNTRDKLVRMQDSIQRGLNLYYQQVGTTSTLKIVDAEAELTLNEGDYPKRIDVLIFDKDPENPILRKELREITYNYDELTKRIYFLDVDFIEEYKDFDVKYRLIYLRDKILIGVVNELEYDFDDFGVPQDIQFMLPYFVKAELYEEEDPQIANQARQVFMQYLMSTRKPFNSVQTKVKKARIFEK